MQVVIQQPSASRETFLDVLRGFAILGIFIANLKSFSAFSYPSQTQGNWFVPQWDNRMLFVHNFLITGKFYAIFSFLFGWGLAMQIHRFASVGLPVQLGLVKRRLAIMLLLGAIHLVIWPGDIVFFYACIGFIFLPFRRFSNKTLLVIALVLELSPIGLYGLKMMSPVFNIPAEFMASLAKSSLKLIAGINNGKEFYQAFMNAGWWETLKLNLGGISFRFSDLLFDSRIPKVLGLVILGYVTGRSGFYSNFAANVKWIKAIAFTGLAIGLPLNYMLASNMENFPGAYYKLGTLGMIRVILFALGVVPLALGYIALFMLLFQRAAVQHALSVFAPVGKMAFTNYIMQSLIGNFVFLPAGLNYMEKLGPVYYTIFALLVFMFQLLFSTIWLKRFQFGPVEWIWRSFTYRKMQPLFHT